MPFVKEYLQQAEVLVYEENGKIKGFTGLSENYVEGIFVEENIVFSELGKYY